MSADNREPPAARRGNGVRAALRWMIHQSAANRDSANTQSTRYRQCECRRKQYQQKFIGWHFWFANTRPPYLVDPHLEPGSISSQVLPLHGLNRPQATCSIARIQRFGQSILPK